MDITGDSIRCVISLDTKGQESIASHADDRESHTAQTIEHPMQVTENLTMLTRLRGTELVSGQTWCVTLPDKCRSRFIPNAILTMKEPSANHLPRARVLSITQKLMEHCLEQQGTSKEPFLFSLD